MSKEQSYCLVNLFLEIHKLVLENQKANIMHMKINGII